LQFAEPETAAGQLAALLSRLDDLAYVLAWSKMPPDTDGRLVSVDFIELPRLQLSFYAVRGADGVTRLHSSDLIGTFISDRRGGRLESVLSGLPHGVLLESMDGELALIVPASLPYRVKCSGRSCFSTELFFMPRRELELKHLDVRYYTYPIHLSHCFMSTPSFSSTIYLLLLRLCNRQYDEVFRLADSCITDTKLTEEEAQIIKQLERCNDDLHPDAHACRIRMAWVCRLCSFKLPWKLEAEMEAYLLTLDQASRKRCVLSPSLFSSSFRVERCRFLQRAAWGSKTSTSF
jgi:hypothetical protein